MNRLLRLLWLALRSRWAERCSTLGPCRTRLRVWPNDLDVFLHVNNGVYFSLCDLARVDLMLRSGSLGVVSGRSRVFLVAAETIQLHRPLGVFQRFDIHTRVLGWDDKAFFVEHRFTVPSRARGASGAPGEETVALCVVEGRVFDRKLGQIRPADILKRLDITDDSPPLPQWVQQWADDQRALRESIRADGDPRRANYSRERTAAQETMRK